MKIEMKKFGALLISRPSGREAFLAASAYIFPKNETELIELDFEGVKVLAPSWADEFVGGLCKNYKNSVKILPSKNPTVVETFKVLDWPKLS